MYEQRFSQWQIYYNHVKDYPEQLEMVKTKTVEVSTYLQRISEDILIEENVLFAEGEGKAVDTMMNDGAHIHEEEPAAVIPPKQATVKEEAKKEEKGAEAAVNATEKE